MVKDPRLLQVAYPIGAFSVTLVASITANVLQRSWNQISVKSHAMNFINKKTSVVPSQFAAGENGCQEPNGIHCPHQHLVEELVQMEKGSSHYQTQSLHCTLLCTTLACVSCMQPIRCGSPLAQFTKQLQAYMAFQG